MVLLSLPLLFNFVKLVQTEDRMTVDVHNSADLVNKSEIRLAQWRQALEYAKSDSFVERYAREQMRFAKPGEIVVIPPAAQDVSKPRAPWWEEFVKPATDSAASAAQPTDGGAQSNDKNH
jgi:hypothetical protein